MNDSTHDHHPKSLRVRGALRSLTLLVAVALPLPGVSGEPTRDVSRHDTARTERVPGVPAALAPHEVRPLLNWAARLSGYAAPDETPEVRLEPSSFFAANACGGRSGPCRVLGWYADSGVVHIHERFSTLDSLFARSLLVHELVHYLQHRSGRFADASCESFVAREHEAYTAQQNFFIAYGAMPAIRAHHFGCPSSDESAGLATARGF